MTKPDDPPVGVAMYRLAGFRWSPGGNALAEAIGFLLRKGLSRETARAVIDWHVQAHRIDVLTPPDGDLPVEVRTMLVPTSLWWAWVDGVQPESPTGDGPNAEG